MKVAIVVEMFGKVERRKEGD
jgi:hypothetical protein